MMGKPSQLEPKLFYHGISLDSRMPKGHPLRKIEQLVDFNFVRSKVHDLYGTRGNESVDPAVILKLMFLLFYENIKSERALMYISTTDPDARLGKKYGKTTLGYKDHRAVDDKYGIVTATVTTPANVNDEKVLAEVINEHQTNTETKVKTAVADKAYGTGENYKYLHGQDITPCISHKRNSSNCDPAFGHHKFIYDGERDCYICPTGKVLKRQQLNNNKNSVIYKADHKTCRQCQYFERCVTSKQSGRQIQRNLNQEYINWADNCLTKHKRKQLMARRKHKAEGSFADAANNHGFKRSRFRGIAKVQIQNLMIAAIQNLRKLMRHISSSPAVQAYNPASTLRLLRELLAYRPSLPSIIVFQR